MLHPAFRVVLLIGVVSLIIGCSGKSDTKGSEGETKSSPAANTKPQTSDRLSKPAATTIPDVKPSASVASNTLKPVDKQPSQNPPPKPATVTQAVDITPFGNLPRLEGAKDIRLEPLEISYSAPISHEKAIDFLASELKKFGWSEVERKKHNDRIHNASFTKQHFLITVSASSGLFSGKSVNISLTNSGNVDVSGIARPKDADVSFINHAYVTYSTEMTVKQLFGFCEKKLTAEGWHKYEMLSDASVAPYGKTAETYIQNGVSLYVVAGLDNDKKTGVSYSSRMFAHEMPLPAEVSELKLYGDDPYVRYLTPDGVPALVAFYRDQAKRSHWEPDETRSIFDEKTASLAYVIPGGKRIIVEMQRQQDGKTIVFQRPAKAEEGGK